VLYAIAEHLGRCDLAVLKLAGFKDFSESSLSKFKTNFEESKKKGLSKMIGNFFGAGKVKAI